MAFAYAAGLLEWKIPEPLQSKLSAYPIFLREGQARKPNPELRTYTKTPSHPSCMQSAASAGVAIPPAAKLTTGRRPVLATSRTSSIGAWMSFAYDQRSRSGMTVNLRISAWTSFVCLTASITLPVPASPKETYLSSFARISGLTHPWSVSSRRPQRYGVGPLRGSCIHRRTVR